MISRITAKNQYPIFDNLQKKIANCNSSIEYNDKINIKFDVKKIYPILPKDSYGFKLRKLRKQKQINADALGKIIGVPGCNLRAIELGKHNPSHPIIRKLYSYFGDDVLFDDYSKYIIYNYNENIKKYRTEHKIIGKDMAKLLGIGETAFFRLEKNSNITYSFFKRLEPKFKELGIIP